MRVKLLTFRYSSTLGGFDDEPLSEFIRDKEVLSFREHFFLVNEVPHLTCVIAFQESLVRSATSVARRPGRRSNSGAPDPGEGLDEPQRLLFDHMRQWRRGKAQQEGVPPYVILTNRELVAVIRGMPESLSALGHVEGIGTAKIKRYGQEILARLHGRPASGGGPHASDDIESSVAEATVS